MNSKLLGALVVASSFAGGAAAVLALNRAVPQVQADARYVEFQTTYQNCTEVVSGYGSVSPIALSCTPR